MICISMRFSDWLENRLPHVNKVGAEIAPETALVKGPKAWNQQEQNCYAIASKVAVKFGYEPIPADEIRSIIEQYKRYWASLNVSWIKAKQPQPPKQGVANFVVRMGDEFTVHVSFEYRGKEYNYGAATPEGFKVLFRIGLKPLS